MAQVGFISNTSSLKLSSDRNISLHTHLLPLNTLDISGNIVVGSSLSGTRWGLDNSMMIESNLGVNTDNPQAPVDIYGAMVVGTSSNYMGNIYGLNQSLVIEDKFYLEEYDPLDITHNVQVNGGITVDGGLYFNKSSTDEGHELSFFDSAETVCVLGMVNRLILVIWLYRETCFWI